MNEKGDEIFMSFEGFMNSRKNIAGMYEKLGGYLVDVTSKKYKEYPKKNKNWSEAVIKTLRENDIKVVDRLEELNDFLIVYPLERENIPPIKICVSTSEGMVMMEVFFPIRIEREEIVDKLLTLCRLHRRECILPISVDLLTGSIIMQYKYLNDYDVPNFMNYLLMLAKIAETAYRRLKTEISDSEREYYDMLVNLRG